MQTIVCDQYGNPQDYTLNPSMALPVTTYATVDPETAEIVLLLVQDYSRTPLMVPQSIQRRLRS